MSDYLFFINKQYETEEGEPCTLGEHLEYVDNYMGTPDCWDSFTGSRKAAMTEAAKEELELFIVDEVSYRVVGHVNKPASKPKKYTESCNMKAIFQAGDNTHSF